MQIQHSDVRILLLAQELPGRRGLPGVQAAHARLRAEAAEEVQEPAAGPAQAPGPGEELVGRPDP